MRLFYTLLLSSIYAVGFSQQQSKHTIYFDFDKDVPTASSQQALLQYIEEIKKQAVSSLEVKGYTDFKGNNSYNNQLSQRRAETIAAQLHKALPAVKIGVGFFGEEQLVSIDEAHQERNRRVEIIYTVASPQVEPEKIIEAQGFYEDVQEQTFTVNTADTIVVKGNKELR